jgi:hypothetical protein
MPITKKAAEFVKNLAKKYPKGHNREDFMTAAEDVELGKMSKAELEKKVASKKDDASYAEDELKRRESNKQKRKAGEPEKRQTTYKDLREGYPEDKEYFADGGMVTKSRSHPLNKFYGK